MYQSLLEVCINLSVLGREVWPVHLRSRISGMASTSVNVSEEGVACVPISPRKTGAAYAPVKNRKRGVAYVPKTPLH